MKKNKKNGRFSTKNSTRKGFYMFSRDLLSSQRYRRCSWVAKGVYCDLLNVLALQPRPGSICLRDFDLRPKNERSLTFRCLQCQKKARLGEYQSIVYFAEAISVSGASGPRPGLIHGLQELYLRGMIIIEGDTMIQPRMYLDNGYELTDEEGNPRHLTDDGVTVVGSPDDAASDPDAERVRMQKSDDFNAEKDDKKDIKKSRVGAGDAPVRQESKSKSNNIDKNNSKKRGVGKNTTEGAKTQNNNPDESVGCEKCGLEREKASGGTIIPQRGEKRADSPAKPQIDPIETSPTFCEFWDAYDKKRDRGASERLWNALKQEDKEAIMVYIPLYKTAQPTKRFRKDPTTFLRHRSWEDEIISDNDAPSSQAAKHRSQTRRTDDTPKQVNDDNFDGMDKW
jgi:hypothetical protein